MTKLSATLYTRKDCHLCQEARAVINKAAKGLGLIVREVDVDQDWDALVKYGEKVPVLAMDGVVVLESYINEALMRDAVEKIRGRPAHSQR